MAAAVPIAVILSSIIIAILLFVAVAAFYIHKKNKKGEVLSRSVSVFSSCVYYGIVV